MVRVSSAPRCKPDKVDVARLGEDPRLGRWDATSPTFGSNEMMRMRLQGDLQRVKYLYWPERQHYHSTSNSIRESEVLVSLH